MRVAVTGSSGLIGRALVPALRSRGHHVLRLVREQPSADEADAVVWSPRSGEVDVRALDPVDGIVHLAGPGLGDRPWTPSRRRELVASRIEGTRTIASVMAALDARPSVLVSASAIGYYGDTGDRAVDETSPRGAGFLAGLVAAWEQAADPAREAGIRVVHPRTGLVLSRRGGVLSRLVLPFKVGLGARIGTGQQYWSVVSLADEVSALCLLLESAEMSGPVNIVAPDPQPSGIVLNEIARQLGTTIRLRLPEALLTPVEQAREMLVFGQRVMPRALMAAGYSFLHPTVHDAVAAGLADRPG